MQISFMDWTDYTWKNELKMQTERVRVSLAEVLDEDFEGEHCPIDMLERALTLAAFSVRRMVEKRLVTDALIKRTIPVRSFPAKVETFRNPFHGRSGGDAYANYHFDKPEMQHLQLKNLADEIIHSSQLMVIGRDDKVPDGLLIASDWHAKRRVLHLTTDEFCKYIQTVLDNHVLIASDRRNPVSGVVTATRE
jgi:hypothetical protein